jgi:hypothetical protein
MTRLRILLVAIVLISTDLCVSSQRSEKPLPTGKLSLRVQVLSQNYCEHGGEGLPTLRFTLLFQFKNLTDRPLTLNHVAADDAIYIGKSARDIHAGKYEPGSRLPDTVGLAQSKGWQTDGSTISPGGTLELRNTNIRIDLATDEKQRKLGASPGAHFLQVFGEAEIADESHGPLMVILSSEPTHFVVDPKPKFGECDQM